MIKFKVPTLFFSLTASSVPITFIECDSLIFPVCSKDVIYIFTLQEKCNFQQVTKDG